MLAVALAVVATTGTAGAVITFEAFQSWEPNSAFNGAVFDARIGDKLVVIVTGEHNFNGSGNGNINSITYDGVLLTEVIDVDPSVPIFQGPGNGDTTSGIWILDDPRTFHTGGVLGASVAGNGNNYVFTAIALSGTAPGVGATASNPGSASVNLTTTAPNSMVISSLGMGGAGSTADVNVVNPVSPSGVIEIDALEAGSNWAGHVVARSSISSPGLNTFSFNSPRTDVVPLAVEILEGDPPPALTLQVNTVTGEIKFLGDSTGPVAINYYEILSSGNSLNDDDWDSLANQDYDGNGPSDGSGNGWEEAGGAGPHAIAEGYLIGDSLVDTDSQVSLGKAFNTSVNNQNLVFNYRTDASKIVSGDIEFIALLDGDYNNDGHVDAADYTVWRDNLGVATTLDNESASPGVVDAGDYAVWRSNFGLSLPASALETSAGVPEPSAMVLIATALFTCLVVERRRTHR